MAFLSIDFMILFGVTFLLYAVSPAKARNWYLLAASCVFIAWNSASFLVMALLVTLNTFFSAQALEKWRDNEKRSRLLYVLSIGVLIGLWVLFHSSGLLEIFPLPGNGNSFVRRLLFPLGMSFYTFQAIGYLTDVYWQETEAERNPLDFSLYMLFFLKFLSGPIERYDGMIRQIRQPESFSYGNAVYGLKLIFLGMMKKLMIANYLSPYTSAIFSDVGAASGLQLLMTCLLYPVELYADFSGYTDMALGGARMFGIRLSPNFNFPFSSRSTADLWRRWHMSLSFWVRDYLFIPLTASLRRRGTAGIYAGLLITFSLLGLWHGLGWTFLIYGLIQGTVIALEMRFSKVRKAFESRVGSKVASMAFIIRTYLLFALSLVFFRAGSLPDAVHFLTHISFSPHSTWKEMNIGMSDHICIVVGITLLLMIVYETASVRQDLIQRSSKLPAWIRWCIYFGLFYALFSLGMFENDSFVYLQF